MISKKNLWVPLGISVIAGLTHAWLLLLFWAQWSALNPLVLLLISKARVVPYYQWVLYPTDFLTSVLLSLPLAVLLLWLRPARPWLYTVCAGVPAVAYWYWPVPSVPVLVWPIFYQLAVLPVAVLIAHALLRRFAPNNSFKPNPLRGSA